MEPQRCSLRSIVLLKTVCDFPFMATETMCINKILFTHRGVQAFGSKNNVRWEKEPDVSRFLSCFVSVFDDTQTHYVI